MKIVERIHSQSSLPQVCALNIMVSGVESAALQQKFAEETRENIAPYNTVGTNCSLSP